MPIIIRTFEPRVLTVLSLLLGTVMLTAQQSNTVSAPAETITVEEAINEALRNNLALLAQRLDLSVANASLVTAALRPNPVISTAADHLDILGTGFNQLNAAGPAEYSTRVDMPIERANKRQFRIETASYARQLAEAELADAARRLRQDVVLACIDLLEAKAKLRLAQDNFAALERLVKVNEARLTGGAIAPVELTRSRVAMLQYAASVKAAELRLTTARLRLLPLLGRPANAGSVDLIGDLRPDSILPPVDIAQLQDQATISRPDLQRLRIEQARSQAELRLQIAQGRIDYTVGMEYRRQQGINGRSNSLGFFFSAPLPVSNRNQGEIARVQAEQERAKRSIRALENSIAGALRAAWQEFDTARQLVTELESTLLRPSEEARDTTAYVYRAGATSLVDVLDAQRAFNETMLILYDSQAAYLRARANLSAVVGVEVAQ